MRRTTISTIFHRYSPYSIVSSVLRSVVSIVGLLKGKETTRVKTAAVASLSSGILGRAFTNPRRLAPGLQRGSGRAAETT